ncbi:hypothetical protein [Natroniella sp. ANB-PHB2]|uniref:hypothetical protein n=1 Tax=Natroniella sp. ANB-PHB2 TaxID=3384444 RepID=UPI0038D3773B
MNCSNCSKELKAGEFIRRRVVYGEVMASNEHFCRECNDNLRDVVELHGCAHCSKLAGKNKH